MPPSAWEKLVLGLAVSLLAAGGAAGQSNDEVQASVQFNFSTPGARSLGLGGAFVAAADDATAAYANPAGLGQLAEPEVSVELRSWSYATRWADRGHLPAEGVTGIGTDIFDGLREGRGSDDAAALSFLSLSYSGRRWTLGLYRHQLADFGANLESHGPFVGTRDRTTRVFPFRSSFELEIAGVGLAGSYRLGNGLFVGGGATRYDFGLDGRTERYYREEPTGDPVTDALTGNHFGPADFLPANLANLQTQTGSDADWAMTLGGLWRIDSRWSVGSVYRQGPAFRFGATFTDGPRGLHPGEVDPSLGGRGVYRVPDVFALGVAFRPTDELLIALDWDRVEYSDLGDDPVNLLRAAEGRLDDFRLDDADEIHLGVEYQRLDARLPWALRLGGWLDPDHQLRYVGTSETLGARFRRGSDDLHLAAGLGLALRRAQVDLGYDRSDRLQTVSLSTVVRF